MSGWMILALIVLARSALAVAAAAARGDAAARGGGACCSARPAMRCRAGRASPAARASRDRAPAVPLTARAPGAVRRVHRGRTLAEIAESDAARGNTAGRGRDPAARRCASIRPIRACGSGSAMRWSTMPDADPGGRTRLSRARPSSRPAIPAPRFFFGLALARSGEPRRRRCAMWRKSSPTRPPTRAGGRWSRMRSPALREPRRLGRQRVSDGTNARSSASATAWWRILPPDTLRPVGEVRVRLHRLFGAHVGDLQRERQGRVVEREGARSATTAPGMLATQ